MVFHSLLYSKSHIHLLGDVQMSFFFLLSGYVLGLNEGKREYQPTPCCSELCASGTSTDTTRFDAKHFYRRRVARTLPLFYLTNLMCIPLVYSGHAYVIQGLMEYAAYVLTLFVANTWLIAPFVLNGPSWFVSSIWFCYWVFPSLLPKLQAYDDAQKRKLIVWLFWIQLVGGLALWIGLSPVPVIGAWSFWAFYSWPPSRLAVFVMGVLAGLLRSQGKPVRAVEAKIPTLLPIPSRCWTPTGVDKLTPEEWQSRSNWSFGIMLALFAVIAAVQHVQEMGASVWLQVSITWLQLQSISALTFEGNKSLTARLLTSNVALWLGRISYALYLVHLPFIQYIAWMLHGSIQQPNCDSLFEDADDCVSVEEWFGDEKRDIPMYCVPIVWVGSVVMAFPLNRLFEEPMRKLLRP